MFKLFIILLCLIFISGCKSIQCDCGNKNCGIECRNKCEDNRCYPGTPCCDKCICSKLESLKK